MKSKGDTYTFEGESVPRVEYEKLRSENEYLKAELAQLKRLIFGSKSERFVPSASTDGQLSLFETPQAVAQASTEATAEQINYTRHKPQKEKKHPVRLPLPAHLPRVEEVIEPENISPGSQKIGEEVTEILEYKPGRVYVRRIVRPKYAKPDKEGVVIALLPSLPVPKSNVGAGFLAQILVSKYIDHLPLYRQIQIYKREELHISQSTMGGWVAQAAHLLEPLYNALEKEFEKSTYTQADESPIKVQDSHKKGSLHTGYQWVYRAPEQGLVLFKYDKGRAGKVPQEFFKTFTGVLQSDGLKVYRELKTAGQITHLACWAHARRNFEKALDNDKRRAEWMLSKIQKLYAIERKARERKVDFETRRRYRSRCATPILKQIKDWLIENQEVVYPKSLIGKAIAYTTNLWKELTGYTEDGRCEIDNNLVENAIRPLALGRKNYLFAGSHSAAQNTAMFYSFFATCKVNDVEPLEWLTDVLSRIPEHKANRLHELLPQNWKKQKPPH